MAKNRRPKPIRYEGSFLDDAEATPAETKAPVEHVSDWRAKALEFAFRNRRLRADMEKLRVDAEQPLRIRLRHELTDRRRFRVEVIDKNNRVLGDLAYTVSEDISWRSSGGLSILTLEFPCERLDLGSLEVPGFNVPSSNP